jgi:hypothetical protein
MVISECHNRTIEYAFLEQVTCDAQFKVSSGTIFAVEAARRIKF